MEYEVREVLTDSSRKPCYADDVRFYALLYKGRRNADMEGFGGKTSRVGKDKSKQIF